MSSDSIVCKDITVQFGNEASGPVVLNHLDLAVSRGTIVSLLGPSGCGKSTLLRVVAGLLKPNSGTVQIEDGLPAQMRSRMSFIFQESALLPWRNVWQNVRLPIELRGQSSSAMKVDIRNALLQVGFRESDFRKMPSELSGGMKMRASIARALITKPDILLLDEPFAALDDMLRSKLNDLLLTIRSQFNCTMLFVTHNIAEAIYLSKSIAVMSQGRIAEQIEIPLPHPRDSNLRSTPQFGQLYGEVANALSRSER